MKNKNDDILTDVDVNLIEAMEMLQKDWVAKYTDELELAEKFTYSQRHIERMKKLIYPDIQIDSK